MKVTVLQENLNKALATAARVVSSRPQMPILSHVLLKADAGGLAIEATNLEIGLRQVIGAKVDQDGSITVPVRSFGELIGNLGPGKVELAVDGMELQIVSQGFDGSLNGVGITEFPQLPRFGDQTVVTLPAESLMAAIGQSVFAAGTDESRPVLTAILMRLNGSKLEMVGTDGFRLSVVSWTADKANWGEHEWLIPAKTLQELGRLIADREGDVELSTVESGNQVIFRMGDIELSTRLVSGKFPDFKRILPDVGEVSVSVGREDLLRAMRLAAVFARESANIVKLDIREGSLVVSANAPQVGGNNAEVDAHVTGSGLRMAFNYKYVLDYLNVVKAASVQLSTNGPLAPGLWTVVGEKGKEDVKMEFKHVIMPVRLEE